jgi:hypothetical protein
MSANSVRTGRSIGSIEFPWTSFLLVFVVASFCLIVAGVLTKRLDTDHPGQVGARLIDVVPPVASPDQIAATSPPRSVALAIAQTVGALLKELGKQAIDQPGHFLIAALPIVLSRQLTGSPWYGWTAVPLLAYREWLQWPSNRWWDPPLDWAVLTLGVIMATWAIRSLPRLRSPVAGAPATPLGPAIPSTAAGHIAR